ncbi:hypothetical protein D3C80_1843320 [compost metagenome]
MAGKRQDAGGTADLDHFQLEERSGGSAAGNGAGALREGQAVRPLLRAVSRPYESL